MRQERSSQNLVIVLLAVAVLAMSIGFATYSQNLTITGTATFKKASWSVKFKDSTWSEAASSINSSAHNITDDTVTYTVTLNQPGDVYTFSIDVENAGTIDARLYEIDLSNNQSSAQYISHTVTYDSANYTNATNTVDKLLTAGSTETVTVTVAYVYPADAANLPTAADVTATLGVTLKYKDKDAS